MKNNGVYAGGEVFDRIFKALGDPHRIQIIELLKERELSAGEILEAVDVVQSTLSHHMKTLSDSGVVNSVRRGKWTWYSLNEDVLSEAAAFLQEYAKGTKQRKTDIGAQSEKEAHTESGSKSAHGQDEKKSSQSAHNQDEKNSPKSVPERSFALADDTMNTKKKKDKKNKKGKKKK